MKYPMLAQPKIKGPGLTRDRLRALVEAAALREFFRQADIDPDAPAVKRALEKRARRMERNRRLVESGALQLYVPPTEISDN